VENPHWKLSVRKDGDDTVAVAASLHRFLQKGYPHQNKKKVCNTVRDEILPPLIYIIITALYYHHKFIFKHSRRSNINHSFPPKEKFWQ
jgi:hypothetical protein